MEQEIERKCPRVLNDATAAQPAPNRCKCCFSRPTLEPLSPGDEP